MNTRPESTLLTLLTYEEKQLIVFLYMKPLNDINPPSNLYWKEKKGASIWEAKTLKQWLVYGEDQHIEALWNEIITTKKVKLQDKEYGFFIPQSTKECEKKVGNAIYLKYGTDGIPQFLLEEQNLLLIEGYKISIPGKITPLKPPGLLPEGFLYRSLSEGFRCYRENRQVYYHFRGTRINKEDQEPGEMTGFVQGDLKNHDYSVEFFTEDGALLGSSKVDKTNGTFKVPFEKPGSKAKFILKDNSNIVSDYNYTLLKGTNLDIQAAGNTFKDAFGRETMITAKEKTFQKPKGYTWHRDLLASEKENKIVLSDYIKNLLNYLGNDILICDPYFLGKVPPETDNEKNSYMVFFNALFSSSVEHKISRFRLLGYWGRASNTVDVKKDQYFENVKKNILAQIQTNNFEKYLSVKCIELLNSPAEFHSRFWIGFKNIDGRSVVDEEKIFFVTNSINGVYNSGEIDFVPCTDPIQIRRIASKYDNLSRSFTEKHLIG